MSQAESPAANTPKPRRLRRWLGELAFVLLAVLAVHVYQTWSTARGIAPPLEGVDLHGQPWALADLRGRPVLVHFWATWCPVCRLEQGGIQAVSGDWSVLSVVLEGTSSADLRTYMAREGLSFPVLRDPDGRWAARYGVRGVPASFVVDADGRIRFTSVGYSTETGLRLRLWLAAKLAGPAPRGADSGLTSPLAAEADR